MTRPQPAPRPSLRLSTLKNMPFFFSPMLVVAALGCGGDDAAQTDAGVDSAAIDSGAADGQVAEAGTDARIEADGGAADGSVSEGFDPPVVCPTSDGSDERTLVVGSDVGAMFFAINGQGRIRDLEQTIAFADKVGWVAIAPSKTEAIVGFGSTPESYGVSVVSMNADGSNAKVEQTFDGLIPERFTHVFYTDQDHFMVLRQPSNTREGNALPFARASNGEFEKGTALAMDVGVPFWASAVPGQTAVLTSTWTGGGIPNNVVLVTQDGLNASFETVAPEIEVTGMSVRQNGDAYFHSGQHPQEGSAALNKRSAFRKLAKTAEGWALDSNVYWAGGSAATTGLSPNDSTHFSMRGYSEVVFDEIMMTDVVRLTSRAIYKLDLSQIGVEESRFEPEFRLASALSNRGFAVTGSDNVLVGLSTTINDDFLVSFVEGASGWVQVCDRIAIESMRTLAVAE